MLLVLMQCKTDECFNGVGSNEIVHIETGYFRKINFNGMFDVMLVQDTMYFVEFEGGKNMLQNTKAENTDSTLWIDNSNNCLFLKDYKKIKVSVHFNDIDEATFSGPCKIRSQYPITDDFTLVAPGQIADLDIELDNNRFFFYNYGDTGGDYVFRGKCTTCTLYGYFLARIDASQLITKKMILQNHSVVDYYVRAEESLHVGIFNRGNVYYYNDPVVTIDSIAGTGRVFKVK
jgi:hypothetical protein